MREHAEIITAGLEEDQLIKRKKAQLDGGENQATKVEREIAKPKSECEATQQYLLVWPKEDQEITIFGPFSISQSSCRYSKNEANQDLARLDNHQTQIQARPLFLSRKPEDDPLNKAETQGPAVIKQIC